MAHLVDTADIDLNADGEYVKVVNFAMRTFSLPRGLVFQCNNHINNNPKHHYCRCRQEQIDSTKQWVTTMHGRGKMADNNRLVTLQETKEALTGTCRFVFMSPCAGI